MIWHSITPFARARAREEPTARLAPTPPAGQLAALPAAPSGRRIRSQNGGFTNQSLLIINSALGCRL